MLKSNQICGTTPASGITGHSWPFTMTVGGGEACSEAFSRTNSGFSAGTVYSASGNMDLTGGGSVQALKLGPATTLNLGANNLQVDSGGIVSGGPGVSSIPLQ